MDAAPAAPRCCREWWGRLRRLARWTQEPTTRCCSASSSRASCSPGWRSSPTPAWLVWLTVRGAARAERAVAPAGRRRAPRRRLVLPCGRRAAAEGRLAEALQLAFVALALTLEGQGSLQYHPSKTPAECAREARLGAIATASDCGGWCAACTPTRSAGGRSRRGLPALARRWAPALACARALSWGSPPALLLVLGVVAAALGGRRGRRRRAKRRRSTYLTGPGGAQRLRRGAPRLGVEVERSPPADRRRSPWRIRPRRRASWPCSGPASTSTAAEARHLLALPVDLLLAGPRRRTGDPLPRLPGLASRGSDRSRHPRRRRTRWTCRRRGPGRCWRQHRAHTVVDSAAARGSAEYLRGARTRAGWTPCSVTVRGGRWCSGSRYPEAGR